MEPNLQLGFDAPVAVVTFWFQFHPFHDPNKDGFFHKSVGMFLA